MAKMKNAWKISLIFAVILLIAHLIKFWSLDFKTSSDYRSVAAATVVVWATFRLYINSAQEQKSKEDCTEIKDKKDESKAKNE